MFADDQSIVTLLARFEGRSVVAIGHQKGRNVKENILRNFGMPHPEGYRKALRAMKLAEKFGKPVLTFIDTPGAYPGIGAEERGQSEAIARNIQEMSQLGVPVICTVIGEGGSGGALAIGVGNYVQMLQPLIGDLLEACAVIPGADARARRKADLKMSAATRWGSRDEIVREPPGGAHRNAGRRLQQARGGRGWLASHWLMNGQTARCSLGTWAASRRLRSTGPGLPGHASNHRQVAAKSGGMRRTADVAAPPPPRWVAGVPTAADRPFQWPARTLTRRAPPIAGLPSEAPLRRELEALPSSEGQPDGDVRRGTQSRRPLRFFRPVVATTPMPMPA
jgi:hypothetical protein